jgi:hypothetical protein
MPARFVRLGIDYGTSASKLIFRDPLAPGGEKAYTIIHNSSIRISSSVAVNDRTLVFGDSPLVSKNEVNKTWLESVKMRVAGEVTGSYQKYCHGPLLPLPDGFTAKDLAILTVWFLLSEGAGAISRFLQNSVNDLRITMTLGIPMSFYEDETLRRAYLEIAFTARAIYDSCGRMGDSRIGFDDAHDMLRKHRRLPLESDLADTDIRNLIRSEAEAAMCLGVKSPAVGPGPYAEVDIGAGTTHASVFSIWPQYTGQRWLKERLAFFGAWSEPYGMDAVDATIAKRRGISRDDCLSFRGTEREVLRRIGATDLVETMDKIRETYLMAWRRSRPKLNLAELETFKSHQVFVTGGGSLVPEIVEIFRRHPSGYERPLVVRRLESPQDLHSTDSRAIQADDLPFIAVAYGLTFDAQEVPETFTPSQFGHAVRPTATRISWEDM